MNNIRYSRKAERQLRKIHINNVRRILLAIDKLETFPKTHGDVTALQNHQYAYRMRTGNYRILFNFDPVMKIISIEEVKKRDDRTY